MKIEDFPLAWRWTQESHAVFPPEVLASLVPLPPSEADYFYARGELLFPQGSFSECSHEISEEDDEPTRVWFRSLPVASQQRVSIAWDRETAISLPWETFVSRWDDFWYPSSDDAFVFTEDGKSALLLNHYGAFEFRELPA